MARSAPERIKLDNKYDAAILRCQQKGTADTAKRFEEACKASAAVFAATVQKLHREVASGTDVYETYYGLERLRNRTSPPTGLDFAKLRPQAEIELLGDHSNIDKLHYACLSFGGKSLEHYGACTVTLKESMIAHRASCFEGNTAVLYHQHRSFDRLVRCCWEDRHVICLAVFADELKIDAGDDTFGDVLVQTGSTAEQDRFVEVHVFGPLTARTFHSVCFGKINGRTETTYARAVKDTLDAYDVEVTGI